MKKLFMLVLLLALVLTACGGRPESSQPAGGDEAPAGEKVTLRFWSHQNDAFNGGYQALGDKYMAENPNVEIVFENFSYDAYIQTLQTSLPAGTEADIMQMFGSWVCSYAEGDNFVPVPDGVLSLADAQEQIFAAPLDGYICDGNLYGVPQEFNIEYGAVMVNTALAQELGATNYEDGWADWDEFIEDAKKMVVVQDGVMTRAGFNYTGGDGLATMFHSLYMQTGEEYLKDGVYTVNTPAGVKTLELMQRFVDEGLVDPVLFNDDENWVGDSFFEQTTGIGLVGPWAVPEYSGDFPEVAAATVYVPLPYEGDTPVFAAASGWGLVVSANSKVQDAAWDFVSYVTLNADNATEWNIASGTLPALQANVTGANADKLTEAYAFFAPFYDILEYGQGEGHFPDRDFVWYEVAYPDVLDFLQGNASLEDTLSLIESEVQGSFK